MAKEKAEELEEFQEPAGEKSEEPEAKRRRTDKQVRRTSRPALCARSYRGFNVIKISRYLVLFVLWKKKIAT